ncbi:hypothetical protein FKM82_029440 [Ascaphus truei]
MRRRSMWREGEWSLHRDNTTSHPMLPRATPTTSHPMLPRATPITCWQTVAAFHPLYLPCYSSCGRGQAAEGWVSRYPTLSHP